MSIPKMMTITEAAQLSKNLKIGISRNHIRTLCLKGKIPCCKAGVKTLLNWNGLMDYLNHPQEWPEPSQPSTQTIRSIPERIVS